MADQAQNLYLNFTFYRDRLERQLLDIRKIHSNGLFPYLKQKTNILVYFVQTVFELGIKKDFYIANTSLKDDDINLSIRPRRTTRLDEEFPPDITLCIRGRLFPPNHHNPELTVERIVDISESPLRSFEREVAFAPAVSDRERRNNLLSDTLVYELPEISKATRENLKHWKDYLAWRREIVETQLAGLRYISINLVEDTLRFYIAAQNEAAFREFERSLQKDELMAFPLEYSTDPWQFNYNRNLRTIYGTPVGRFKRSREFSPNSFREELNGCPWSNPFVSEVIFKLAENDQAEYDAASEDDRKNTREFILKKFSENGYLAISLVGEFTVINRQAQALENLELESGYSPFLSSWLFDIGKANTPQITQPVESWLMKHINEDQQKAVKKMLGAPDVALMQGPPGTGKTTVIGEAIYQFARQGKKIVLASQANLAVDNALEKLASVPEIRAIRLGRSSKFSPEGQQFAEDRVLKKFYYSIADACEQHWLAPWQETEMQIETLQKQLADLESLEKALEGLNREITALEEAPQSANKSITDQQAEDTTASNDNPRFILKTELQKLVRFLNGSLDVKLQIPDKLLELIHASIISGLAQLKKYKIDLLPSAETDFNGLSSSEKNLFFQSAFQQWFVLKNRIPEIQAEIQRMKESKNRISFDPENRMLLKQLYKKLEQVEIALENGDDSQLAVWRQLRRKIQVLESQATLDPELYAAVFNLQENGKPFYQRLMNSKPDKAKLAAFLALTLKGIHDTGQRVEKASTLLVENVENIITRLDVPEEKPREAEKIADEADAAQSAKTDLAQTYQARENELKSRLEQFQTENGIETESSEEKLAHIKNELQDKIMALRAEQEQDAEFREKWQPLLSSWTEWLTDEEQIANDNEHFIETYIDNCNVVGITCNENRRLLESKRQSCFDIAIIDEVSKATPPELLLPMLMAKKSILVGDHRQLPPLFKEREGSWMDAVHDLEESGTPLRKTLLTEKNFRRFKDMVTASLFKTYFENAPGAIKSTLETQYRMHPDIMDVTNHFYDYRLKCGLGNPDEARDHRLNIPAADGLEFITPNTHAVWIDSSNDPLNQRHFETQSGTSKMNMLEAILIVELLKKIDNACQLTGFNHDNRKAIGVISFYGRQVGEIRRRLRQEKFEALDIDVNTVDQFQGKEKSIILVSLVRNVRSNSLSNKSFVAQFERINVAFSRAQELLFIFGAKDMFAGIDIDLPLMDQPGSSTKKIYGDIIEGLNRKSHFWKSSRVISAEDWGRLNI